MQILSSFQFKPQNIQIEYLQLRTKLQSLAFGRMLYEYQDRKEHYWLKTQCVGHKQYELGFQRELEFYQHLNADLTPIIFPYAVCKLPKLEEKTQFGELTLIVPHGDLWFRHAPQDLSRDQIIQKILQALSALERLHQQGWIHGDLKREHFYDVHGSVKLLDFEQSFRLINRQQQNLNATPRYMAPELFHHSAKNYASDVYALGIILLEWLQQQRLLAKSYQDWAILHCQRLNIELPSEFESFIPVLEMMLKKDKTHRVIDFSALKTRLILDNV